MSDNCPQCGFKLKDFYKQKIEDELKSDFEKQKKDQFIELNQKIDQANLEKERIQSQLDGEKEILTQQIKQSLSSAFREKEIEFKTKEIELNGQIHDLKQTKRAEVNVAVNAKLQEQKSQMIAEFKLENTSKDIEIQRLNDLIKDLEEKSSQTSQQAQGEVGEILIEETLKHEFPLDKIIEVAKGINGADVSHHVIDRQEREIGIIYIESKNARKFSASWVSKLKEDVKSKNASYGVLVTTDLPENVKQYEDEDLFICGFHDYLLAVKLLRVRLVEIAKNKFIEANRSSSSELVYNYVTSREFAQWMRSMLDYVRDQQTQLEKDKRQFNQSIAVREKQIQKINESHQYLIGHFRGLGSQDDFELLENISEES